MSILTDYSGKIKPSEAPLTALAEQINAHHEQVVQSLNSGLEHAQQAGALLLQAKEKCPHGGFGPWLAANFTGSRRTARGYIRIAKHWPAIAKEKGNAVAVLSYRGALKFLSAPRKRDRPAIPGCALEKSAGGDDAFAASLPELSPDLEFMGIDIDDPSYQIEILPSVKHPGYFYLAEYLDLDTDAANVEYLRRPAKLDRGLLANVLKFRRLQPTHWLSKPTSGLDPWFISPTLGRPAPAYRRRQIA